MSEHEISAAVESHIARQFEEYVRENAPPTDAELREIRERKERAFAAVVAICHGKQRWTMSIPAQPERDTDLVISAALGDTDRLLDEIERLRADARRLDWVLADCIGEADEKARFTDVYLPMLWVPTDKGVTPESLRAAIDRRIASGEEEDNHPAASAADNREG